MDSPPVPNKRTANSSSLSSTMAKLPLVVDGALLQVGWPVVEVWGRNPSRIAPNCCDEAWSARPAVQVGRKSYP